MTAAEKTVYASTIFRARWTTATVPASIAAWLRLLRVVKRIQRLESASLDRWGLTLPQFDVLAQLAARDGVSQQTLADRLLVTKGNVCGVLDRLEARGLVARRPDPNDRRANLVVLTPAGRRLARRVVPEHEALIVRLLGGLAGDDQRELLRLARTLDRSLRADPCDSGCVAAPFLPRARTASEEPSNQPRD
ncbi:MAG: hypothetical protein KatS3mg060_2419 [Dehalococcoidia bacterium]|nr:MAG: hypothetical protein KatS3mg060_2419 [Dehalococcoidia bacterium]